jgi:uncharacterized protein YhbP (UPF0306 family)
MPTPRELLEEYVGSGKLMQVATLGADGGPAVCNVWYHAHFAPDLLHFVSRRDRHHSVNIRNDPRIAGSIVAMDLEGLGQQVRGVTFTGSCQELGADSLDTAMAAFLQRWPRATISAEILRKPETPTRLYEIAIEEWVFFDEENFADEPRRVMPGIGRSS